MQSSERYWKSFGYSVRRLEKLEEKEKVKRKLASHPAAPPPSRRIPRELPTAIAEPSQARFPVAPPLSLSHRLSVSADDITFLRAKLLRASAVVDSWSRHCDTLQGQLLVALEQHLAVSLMGPSQLARAEVAVPKPDKGKGRVESVSKRLLKGKDKGRAESVGEGSVKGKGKGRAKSQDEDAPPSDKDGEGEPDV